MWWGKRSQEDNRNSLNRTLETAWVQTFGLCFVQFPWFALSEGQKALEELEVDELLPHFGEYPECGNQYIFVGFGGHRRLSFFLIVASVIGHRKYSRREG